MQGDKSSRLAQLDVVRGIAALMVVFFHYTVRYQYFLGENYHNDFLFRLGFLGVNFFFMVSGFVIFMTLCRTATGTDFVVSRFSRLFPAYWLAVLVTALFDNLLGPTSAERSTYEVLVNLTMLQEFLHVRHVDGVYWTLTCELIFYAWMFLLYKSGMLRNATRFVAAWLVVAIFAAVYLKVKGSFPERISRYLLLDYAYLFSSGILFYEVYVRRANLFTYALLAACLLNAALIFGFSMELVFIFLFFAIFLAIALGKANFLNFRGLAFFGTISYSLYLLHENLGYLVLGYLHRKGMDADLAVGTTVLLAIGAASLATYLVERPAMNAIRRFYKERIVSRRLRPAARTGE